VHSVFQAAKSCGAFSKRRGFSDINSLILTQKLPLLPCAYRDPKKLIVQSKSMQRVCRGGKFSHSLSSGLRNHVGLSRDMSRKKTDSRPKTESVFCALLPVFYTAALEWGPGAIASARGQAPVCQHGCCCAAVRVPINQLLPELNKRIVCPVRFGRCRGIYPKTLDRIITVRYAARQKDKTTRGLKSS